MKYQHFAATTYSDTWDTRNAGAASLTNGGLDGDARTVYDNLYMVSTPAKLIRAKRTVGVVNWTAAIGYNFNDQHKVYVRYSDGKNPAAGVVQRYSTVATLVRPLGRCDLVVVPDLGFCRPRARLVVLSLLQLAQARDPGDERGSTGAIASRRAAGRPLRAEPLGVAIRITYTDPTIVTDATGKAR